MFRFPRDCSAEPAQLIFSISKADAVDNELAGDSDEETRGPRFQSTKDVKQYRSKFTSNVKFIRQLYTIDYSRCSRGGRQLESGFQG